MPYQEHLQQAGRELAHTGGLQGPRAWLAALICGLLLQAGQALGASGLLHFTRIEAARSTWDAAAPPATGWQAVQLPDDWSMRWPQFDGVVWYRLSWEQPAAVPTGLMLEYLSMAGAVYLNGTPLWRDWHLQEPLTRAWNTPRYWLLAPPVLRQGSNQLLIRVSGLAPYQPGLGPVKIGGPDLVRAQYEHAWFVRQSSQRISLAVTLVLGCFFLTLWLMRRQQTAYGWFSLMSLAWWLYAVNQIATSPWPFATNDGWQRFTTIALLTYCGSFAMFIVRFCERRLPRTETALWITLGIGVGIMAVTPHAYMYPVRAALSILSALIFFSTCLAYLHFAWRSRQADHWILALCVSVFMAAGVHDLLVFLSVLNNNLYYTALTSQLLMVSMAVVLARRFVTNLRHIERFNVELSDKIAQAREELRLTLQRQHELEVSNARLGERLRLAHDLHDGLGGTLVSSIATLEHAPNSIGPERFVEILKELRDDLRIVIDAAAARRSNDTSLEELIAPLRHRLTRALENQSIECRWNLSVPDSWRVPAEVGLELLRLLQEALTNVLKHSRASRVDVELRGNADALILAVSDNGIGLDPAALARHPGTGMRSMRQRAQRLGGRLDVDSAPGRTTITMHLPLDALIAPGSEMG